jgi:hypothetical protein
MAPVAYSESVQDTIKEFDPNLDCLQPLELLNKTGKLLIGIIAPSTWLVVILS